MNPLFLLIPMGFIALAIGSVLGYFARQSIARKRADKIETTLQKKIAQVKKDAEEITLKAKQKADQIIRDASRDTEGQRRDLFSAQKLLTNRENTLTERVSVLDKKEDEFRQRVEKLKEIKTNLEDLRTESIKKLERVAKLSKEEAKRELLKNLEQEYQVELLGKMQKLEQSGFEKYEMRAKDILASAIQKFALSQSQELTTTTVSIPSDDLKGRIIGKEGRNIRTLEKLTGVEIVIDETPEAVMISGFDPVRRQIAKIALERLIQDGRIQPARIEEIVHKVESEIVQQVKDAGERAIYETGIVDLDPKVVQLLGRLRFRTSYGQNVLLHSIEVAFLAEAIASELGANVAVAKKGGLLHDIGKAVDHQIQGSHTDIGIRILEKFNVGDDIIDAMKAHHEEHPAETLEAVIVQVADQISGARPGARKDSLEHYIKRLQELESIAEGFKGVDKVYAIQAGREVRVFVNPEVINDYDAKKLSRDIANKIQEELKYPGEIKVTVIRENRVIEYAR
ncbi:ribonuclease Y [Patescibacteria group bacterium]|nr:ribonuclease Y [Patescibacteria group bacterium]